MNNLSENQKERLRKVSPNDIVKYQKVVKNNTGKKVKINKKNNKSTKIKKSTIALLIAAGFQLRQWVHLMLLVLVKLLKK